MSNSAQFFQTPLHLSGDNIAAIEASMLGSTDNIQPPGLGISWRVNYSHSEDYPLPGIKIPINDTTRDYSLRAQLETLVSKLATPGEQTSHFYAFTANSAIPVADSIRGYYDELNIGEPTLAAIHIAKKANIRPPQYADNQYRESVKWIRNAMTKEAEVIQNDHPEIPKAACVIDQYVSTGSAISRAAGVLHMAGVETVYTISGNWYHDANKYGAIDPIGMTSAFSSEFEDIGRKAAELRANSQPRILRVIRNLNTSVSRRRARSLQAT